MSSYDQHPRQANRPSSTGERRRREPERGRGARVTGLRPYPCFCDDRKDRPGGVCQTDRREGNAQPAAVCGRNSGSSSPAGRRIWGDNRQGGGIGISPVTAALKLQVLQEVGKTIDRIDETAEQDNFGFSL